MADAQPLITWLVSSDYWKACIRAARAQITGLEKLSDADLAAYLNTHSALVTWAGMPVAWTAAMIHEVRTAPI